MDVLEDENDMTDEQFAEEVKDLVNRINAAGAEGARRGLDVEFEVGNAVTYIMERQHQKVRVYVSRPL